MLTILHGDDEVKVHTALMQEMDVAKKKGAQLVRLSAKGLETSDVENALGTLELFVSEKCVIVDGLFSLPKSKLKDELIRNIYVQSSKFKESGGISVILVENKILTAAQLKNFPDARVILFKLPVLLFQFVESIGLLKPVQAITKFHEVLNTQDAEFVFVMIIRQIRLLLGYVADGVYDGPPFGKQKLERQAAVFSVDKLLDIHRMLLDIDTRQKTSRNSLTLVQEIDLLLTQL